MCAVGVACACGDGSLEASSERRSCSDVSELLVRCCPGSGQDHPTQAVGADVVRPDGIFGPADAASPARLRGHTSNIPSNIPSNLSHDDVEPGLHYAAIDSAPAVEYSMAHSVACSVECSMEFSMAHSVECSMECSTECNVGWHAHGMFDGMFDKMVSGMVDGMMDGMVDGSFNVACSMKLLMK